MSLHVNGGISWVSRTGFAITHTLDLCAARRLCDGAQVRQCELLACVLWHLSIAARWLIIRRIRPHSEYCKRGRIYENFINEVVRNKIHRGETVSSTQSTRCSHVNVDSRTVREWEKTDCLERQAAAIQFFNAPKQTHVCED